MTSQKTSLRKPSGRAGAVPLPLPIAQLELPRAHAYRVSKLIRDLAKDPLLDKFTTFITTLRHLESDMPIQQAHLLLAVAQKPGASASELEQITGLSGASISRNLTALSQGRKDAPGLNLVEQRRDPDMARRFLNYLTPSGAKLLRCLIDA